MLVSLAARGQSAATPVRDALLHMGTTAGNSAVAAVVQRKDDSPKLWWKRHRLLRPGDHGEDVERVQRALTTRWDLPVPVTATFDAETERAVREFQTMMDLVVDGLVGPVTNSMLTEGFLRYVLPRPPRVDQGAAHLCWAASLESVLRDSWAGPQRSMQALRVAFSDRPHGAISESGLVRAGAQLGFGEIMQRQGVFAGRIIRALRSRRPLIFVTIPAGAVGHARVVYGVDISHGAIDLLVMDPMQGYTRVPIGSMGAADMVAVLASD